jgi:hypothetical protein
MERELGPRESRAEGPRAKGPRAKLPRAKVSMVTGRVAEGQGPRAKDQWQEDHI